MKKQFVSYLRKKRSESMPLLIPSVCLLFGVLVALLLVSNSQNDTISGFAENIIFSREKTLLISFWDVARFHIYIALLSTSFLGVALIPLILMYKGYLMCLSSTALILDTGTHGLTLLITVLGLPMLVSIPTILIVTTTSLELSGELFLARTNNFRKIRREHSFKKILLCIAILIPLAMFEIKVLPILVEQILS